MDIRKFFGVGSNVKFSEKPDKTISNSASSASSKPQNKPSTSKKSPRSPAKSKAKFSHPDLKITVQAKNKTGLKNRPDDDSDTDDFSKELIHSKTAAKRKKEPGDEITAKPKAFSEETVKNKKTKKQKVKESKYEDSHKNNNGTSALSKSKSVCSPTKKRKRTLDQSFDKSSAEEEEAPIAKRNPAPQSTHRAVIFDSESDEDPLPKGLRDDSSQKKPLKQHFEDEEKPSLPIVSAFGKTHPKNAAISNQVPSASITKQPVNANDFFGTAPIQRKETYFVENVEGNPKKGCSEVNYMSGVRLSEKLAVKKKEFDNRESSKTTSDDPQQSILADVTHINTSARKSQRLSPQKTKVASPAAKTPDSVKKGSRNEMAAGSSEKGQMQKKGSAAYLAYKNREPPKALGVKEIPQGAENCLEGLTFVITGVLESIERDEAKGLVERHGGKVMQNVSKNTKYLVVGRDAGEAKISKAQQLKITQLDEDGLFALVRTLPGKKSKYELAAASEKPSSKKTSCASVKPSTVASSSAFISTTPDSQTSDALTQLSQQTLSPEVSADNAETLMWVDRYRPISSKQIIGQQGDKSNAKKLFNWLTAWHRNLGKKPVFGRTSDDGAGYKAALLSGPPGVGKTTTAQIICQEAGVSFVELNASDTRSKRSLKEEVSEALDNHTLVDFFGKKGFQSGSVRVDGQKHCLIMDEVDGMAGNEDRGGMQELIQLIKQSKIPIICMCNDRNHPKIRSLSNYCFDLRFQRPRVEQIKGAMMSIAYKEGLKIPPPALNDIIQAANQDIRQILHNLSMWTIKDKTLSYEQLKQEAKKAQKDLHLGPFDVCRKVFVGGEETSKMTLNDKSDLFFHDYSIGPLFVQENYIHVSPFQSQGNSLKHLQCLSRAADSIAIGDLVDGYVRRGGRWNLLPTQAIFASVIPGEKMRGTVGQMIQFPSWLGKNSTTSKNDRLHQELRTHMRLNISANKKALGQEYLPALRTMLTSPLINEASNGVGKVVSILDAYDLLREDFDSIIELTSWTGMKDPMSQIDSKVKAAFTRAYNKEVHLTPYATVAVAKKGKRRGESANQEDYELETGEDSTAVEESEHSGDEDITADSMIKTKKTSSKGTKGNSVEQSESSGRGKGKGKNSKKSV